MDDFLSFLFQAVVIGFLSVVVLSLVVNSWFAILVSNGTFDGVLSSASFEEWRTVDEIRQIYHQRNREPLPELTVGFCLVAAEANKLAKSDTDVYPIKFKRVPGGKRPPSFNMWKLFRGTVSA